MKEDWRTLAAALVANHHSEAGQAEEPFYFFEFELPATPPRDLPELADFYRLCGGGSFGVLSIYSPEQFEARRPQWKEILPPQILLGGARKVIGEESDGVPLVLDSETGFLRTYYWRDAWTDPEDGWADLSFETLEDLWAWLFDAEEHEEEWGKALRKIRLRLEIE